MTEIGPVQLLNIGFEPGANFEGRIAEIVVLEHQEENMGAIVAALLGLQLDGEEEQDFLTPETVGSAEPKLAAISAAIEQDQLS